MSFDISKQSTSKSSSLPKQKSYNEIVEFLDSNWIDNRLGKLDNIKKMDQAFGSPSKSVNAILVNGTNGKSLFINFISQLLKEEGLKVGSFYAPHILTYNERFTINNESISNKNFTDIANEVINQAESLGLKPHSLDILTMIALLYFKNNNVDIAVLETSIGNEWDPVNICYPKIVAITRITPDNNWVEKDLEKAIKEAVSVTKKDSWVISADQSKINLQIMQDAVKAKNGVWAMPIRKLATLNYPYEQLHGRSAALAERVAQIYVQEFLDKNSTVVTDSLLAKPKVARGRPSIEAKRQAELNPRKTVDQFWKDVSTTLPSRFQLLDKEKPTILLDNASNLDAFKNLLLGIRILHYQKPLKGLTLIVGCEDSNLDSEDFIKLIRYFFKKTSGQIIFCPVKPIAGSRAYSAKSWDIEKITNDAKTAKIKAKSAKNFEDAFETAKKSVDDRNGLVVIAGSNTIIWDYWNYKGIKKLS